MWLHFGHGLFARGFFYGSVPVPSFLGVTWFSVGAGAVVSEGESVSYRNTRTYLAFIGRMA